MVYSAHMFNLGSLTHVMKATLIYELSKHEDKQF